MAAGVGFGANVTSGVVAGVGTLFLTYTVLPFAYLTNSARRLAKLGFSHKDIEPAFHAELERAKEELATTKQAPAAPTLRERWLFRISRISWALTALGVFLAFNPGIGRLIGPTLARVLGNFVAAFLLDGGLILVPGIAGVFGLIWAIAVKQERTDVDGEFWASVWRTRLGRFAFALGRKLLAEGARGSAMTHRATELSLGLAAEQLFENLPKDARQQLGDIPALLERLQQDAQELRRRRDDIQVALDEAGEAAAGAGYADVREVRDELHVKLGETVSALETIRLNLLRLHAGSLSVQSVTTHLGIAAEVSEEVERLIAAHGEVASLLKFPRAPATTPV